MSDSSLLLKPIELGNTLRLGRSEAYEFVRAHPEITIHLPGVRGVRVSRRRLEALIDRLSSVETCPDDLSHFTDRPKAAQKKRLG